MNLLRIAPSVLILASMLTCSVGARAANVTYDGMIDGAGQNVLIDYGTPSGGHGGIGYAFVGTTPWTNVNGGNAFDTATESVLRLGTPIGSPYHSYPSFLNNDPANFTMLTGSNDSVRLSQGFDSGGANRGFYRFRYGILNDPALPDSDPNYRVQSLILVNDTVRAQQFGYFGNTDGSWDLLDFHLNGVGPVPDEFLLGVIVDNGNGDNDCPDSLRLRQITAGAGGSIGTDTGLVAMTNNNGGVRQSAEFLMGSGHDTLPNETDVYWFKIAGAVLGDVFTLSGTNNNENVPIANALVFAMPGVSPVLPGDYDGNGMVNSADYDKWKQDFGTSVTASTGADGNGNGVIDAADYTVWRDHFTAGAGAGLGAATAVPEPGSAVTCAIVVFALLPVLRRRRSENCGGHGRCD
jgi:hypothetical protein